MPLIPVAVAVLAGAVLAPVLRVAVFCLSVPYGQRPRDACPACTAPLLPAVRRHGLTLLPVTGICPHCRHRIGPPAGLVEATTIGALAALALRVHEPLPLLAFSWLACCGVLLGYIDLAVHRLPDQIQAPAAIGAITPLAAQALAAHHPAALLRMTLCGLVLGAAYLVLVLGLGQHMGPGDAKLAAILATTTAFISVAATITATLAAFALAGITAALLLATKRVHRGQQIAFGPFMLAGALIAVLFSA
jgi:leader peptidase (prepilin peptidase)/N-methyltransferase